MALFKETYDDGTTKYVDDMGSVYTHEQAIQYKELRSQGKLQDMTTKQEYTPPAGYNMNTVNQMAAAYGFAHTPEADKIAKEHEAARITNLPVGVAFDRAKPEVMEAAKRIAISKQNEPDWQQFTQQYPQTTKFLTEPANMLACRNDLDAIAGSENLYKGKTQFELALKHLDITDEIAAIGNNALLAGLREDELPQERQERLNFLRKMSQQISSNMTEPESFFEYFGIDHLSQQAATLYKDAPDIIKNAFIFGALGTEVPIVGNITGAGIGATATMGQKQLLRSLGSKWLQNSSYKDTSDQYISKGAALAGTLSTTALDTALAMGGGGSKLAAAGMKIPGFARLAANKALSKNALLKAATNVTQSVVEQYGFGVAMQGSSMAGESIAKFLSNQEFAVNPNELGKLEQLHKGGMSNAAMGLMFSLPHVGYSALSKSSRDLAIASIQQNNFVKSIKSIANAKEIPEGVKADFLNMLAKEHEDITGEPASKVYFQTDELQKYLKSVEPDIPNFDKYVMEKAGLGKEYAEALTDGSKMSFPISELIKSDSKFAKVFMQEKGKFDIEAIKDHMSFSEDGQSVSEAKKANIEAITNTIKAIEELNAIHKKTEGEKPPAWLEAAYKSTYDKLVGAGESKSRSYAAAKLLTSFLRVHEERSPETFDIPSLLDNFTVEKGIPSTEGVLGSYKAQADNGALISLFKDKNTSTIFHELGHYFLDLKKAIGEHEEGSVQDKADYKAIRDFLGAKESEEFSKAHHEKFAKSFEAYLMEGKTPSTGLIGVFNKLKAWLINLYKDVTNFGVYLTPEVRSVFDRMLASEEEVKQAEAFYEYGKTFGKENLKISDFKQYISMLEKSRAEAFKRVMKRKMEELKPEFQKRLQIAETLERDRIEKELAEEPIYKNMDLIEKDYGMDASKVAGEFLNGTLEHDAEFHFNFIAETLGYSSGDEFAKAIKATPSWKDKVSSILADRIKQFKDNELGSIKEEAAHAVNNQFRHEVIALESELLKRMHESMTEEELARQASEGEKSLVKEEAKKRSEEVEVKLKEQAEQRKNLINMQEAARFSKLSVKTIRDYVKSTIQDKTLGELKDWQKSFSQVRKYAKLSEQAYKRGDYEEASKYKNYQLINSIMAEEAINVRRQIEKDQTYIDKLSKLGKDKFLKEENMLQIGALLDRFGIKQKAYDPKMEKLSLQDWVKNISDNLGAVPVADWLISDRRDSINNLTVRELNDLRTAVNAMKFIDRQENLSLRFMKKALFQQVVSEIISDVNKKDVLSPKIGEDTSSTLRAAIASMTDLNTMFYKLAGNKSNSAGHRLVLKPMYECADNEFVSIEKFHKNFKEVMSVYSKIEVKELFNKKIFIPELKQSLTKMHLITMALNLGNEGNASALIDKRIFGLHKDVNWNRETVETILENNLNTNDVSMINGLFKILDDMWVNELSEFQKDHVGHTPEGVEAVPYKLMLKDGGLAEITGGYYPLVEDLNSRKMASDNKIIDETVAIGSNNNSINVRTKQGHYKERTKFNKPVSLDFSYFFNHVSDAYHDLHFRDFLIDYKKLLNNDEFKQAVTYKLGPEYLQAMRDQSEVIAQSDRYANLSSSISKKLVNSARERMTCAVILGNAKMMAEDIATNWALYGNTVDGFSHTDATKSYIQEGLLNSLPKAIFDYKEFGKLNSFIAESSPFMRQLFANPDISIGNVEKRITTIVGAGGISEHLMAYSSHALAMTDMFSATPMWLGAYKKKLAETKSHEEAVYFADSVVRGVHAGHKYGRATILTSKDTFNKTITMFYSFMNNEFNRFAREVGLATEKIENAPRFLGYLTSRLFIAVGGFFAKGLYSDDDEDKFTKMGIFSASHFTGMVPLVRDVVPQLLEKIGGVHNMGYRITPLETIGQKVVDIGKTAHGYFAGSKDAAVATEEVTNMLPYIFAYPQQINTFFWNGYDYWVNGMKPEWKDFLKRRPIKER